ncbi:hypothetical protein [Legionella tucsonensis]|uniref:Uncharacterized protein n=1 Tax=Legionella tucsonensis TaxID=40335 RepID=A0A0W0ZXF1_9GAMM|nr:hypothetical protein [Legionella tucsonensis]KTD73686.1 hypothetical protein Ltuc_1533 [Legionella tucsonensis]
MELEWKDDPVNNKVELDELKATQGAVDLPTELKAKIEHLGPKDDGFLETEELKYTSNKPAP